NMALTLADLKRWDEAEGYYQKALDNMRLTENGEAEQAVTWLNLADLYGARDGIEDAAERIDGCLETALALLDAPSLPHDGDYAYYCRTCAPTFRYYGRFADANDLEKRAEDIYESNR
ncbi:MAG: tetratricopeptide repeat protein, partial [Clostridia bacterium]|nr:tetratricopeptide repeat protein [Clostridia bacterium]